jgi:cell cycle arrest protein BUB3
MSSSESAHSNSSFFSNLFTDLYPVEQPPGDAISAVHFSPHPDSNRLVVSSWDRALYVYEVREGKVCSLVTKLDHDAPVLDVAFGKNDSTLYTASLDHVVRR